LWAPIMDAHMSQWVALTAMPLTARLYDVAIVSARARVRCRCERVGWGRRAALVVLDVTATTTLARLGRLI
jgi:hypothetical protein